MICVPCSSAFGEVCGAHPWPSPEQGLDIAALPDESEGLVRHLVISPCAVSRCAMDTHVQLAKVLDGTSTMRTLSLPGRLYRRRPGSLTSQRFYLLRTVSIPVISGFLLDHELGAFSERRPARWLLPMPRPRLSPEQPCLGISLCCSRSVDRVACLQSRQAWRALQISAPHITGCAVATVGTSPQASQAVLVRAHRGGPTSTASSFLLGG